MLYVCVVRNTSAATAFLLCVCLNAPQGTCNIALSALDFVQHTYVICMYACNTTITKLYRLLYRYVHMYSVCVHVVQVGM